MNTFPSRRRTFSQRAAALALAILVNAGIAGFIHGLASAAQGTAGMAFAKPVAVARA
jgi:hypothetical protein